MATENTAKTQDNVIQGKFKKDAQIRPTTFETYIGQEDTKLLLKTYITAALGRGETLDHMLFFGPAGIGKTTLCGVIANELRSKLHVTSAPSITKPGDLAELLMNIQEGDVLFIDEIHALPRIVEESLYSVMEDFRLDIMLGAGQNKEAINMNIPRFTLIGATTRAGSISTPLRRRFRIQQHLKFFTVPELTQVVIRTAEKYGLTIDESSAIEIAKRGRGTPAITNNLVAAVRDFAQVHTNGYVQEHITFITFDMLGVDNLGLSSHERLVLETILFKFRGGPVGLSTLATALQEDPNIIEGMYESYPIRLGLMQRTPQGREITKQGRNHLKLLKLKADAGVSMNSAFDKEEPNN